MSTLVDRPVRATHSDGKILVALESGLELSFPIEGNPRLEGKPEESLSRIELSPFGLHWPDPDEDVSIRGILSGDFGQRRHQAA
jgi:hypothetical protein